jgi:hypothetical protein
MMEAEMIPTNIDLDAMFAAIREANAEYPVDLLSAQRARFVAQIHAAQPVAPWTADAFAAGEPDDATDIKTPPISEQQDARNSRPEPY